MTRLAFDIATNAVRQVQSYEAAKQETAAYVSDPLAFDSAAGLYGAALKAMGVPVEPILRNQTSALHTLFTLARKGRTKSLPVAMDAKASASYDAMFPNARRLRQNG